MLSPVAVGITDPVYQGEAPFHPDTAFPELPLPALSRTPNRPYALLRELLAAAGLDAPNFGTSSWNPLGTLVQPGQTVLLKPNYVTSFNGSGDDLFAVVTHPSILRALVDYAFIALRGQGRIVIADAPDMSCQWDDLMRAQRLDAIQSWYHDRHGFPIEFYDLRNFAMRDPTGTAFATDRVARPGDPAGHTMVNLGRRSAFYGLPSENYYGADYNREETIRHHQGDTHEYCISNTFLRADLVLSVPKMKVHKKVGVTLNLKGLVGANTNKNCLIHYRIGSPRRHGDQLPDSLPSGQLASVRMQRWLFDRTLARQSRWGDSIYAALRAVYRRTLKPFVDFSQQTIALDGGNWHGNDSAWRMTSDLAKILFFADRQGILQSTAQRKVFCVVDGIIAGEGEGPLAPTAKPCGCLVAGANPFAVDLVTSRLMGFDPGKIRQFGLLADPQWDFGLRSTAEVEVRFRDRTVNGAEFFSPADKNPHFGFRPHSGWIGQLEVSPRTA